MFDKCTDHGNDVMVAKFVSLCLVHLTFQKISKEMDVKLKTVNVIVKKNRQQLFIVFTVIDHGNDNKIFKTLQ